MAKSSFYALKSAFLGSKSSFSAPKTGWNFSRENCFLEQKKCKFNQKADFSVLRGTKKKLQKSWTSFRETKNWIWEKKVKTARFQVQKPVFLLRKLGGIFPGKPAFWLPKTSLRETKSAFCVCERPKTRFWALKTAFGVRKKAAPGDTASSKNVHPVFGVKRVKIRKKRNKKADFQREKLVFRANSTQFAGALLRKLGGITQH